MSDYQTTRLMPRLMWALMMSCFLALATQMAAEARPRKQAVAKPPTATQPPVATANVATPPDIIPAGASRPIAYTQQGFCRFSRSLDPPSPEWYRDDLLVDVANIGTGPAGSQQVKVTFKVWTGGRVSDDVHRKNNDDSIPAGGRTPTSIRFNVPLACFHSQKCSFTIRVDTFDEVNKSNNSVSATCGEPVLTAK